MTQRRAIEARLSLYDELSGILGAMRSFALAELHRIARREEAQQQVVEVLKTALQEVVRFLPLPPPASQRRDVWLLLGSVRGFCGSFNDDVIRVWQSAAGPGQPTLAMGARLVAAMPAGADFLAVEGAESGLDAAPAIDRILAALDRRRGPEDGLVVCLHDEHEVRQQRLLPLPAARGASVLPPLMNEPPPRVAAGVVEHFLFHALLAALLRSIRVENRRRLLQMDNAMHHIEENREDLARQRNRLRQEEIIEEIEIMTGLGRVPNLPVR